LTAYPTTSQTLIEPKREWSIALLADDRPVPRPLLICTALAVVVLYALLWSPYYYPLSDSSLYLTVAKGLASGKGLGFVRETHRSIRPITPIVFATIIKLGGDIGVIHVVMTVFTLASLSLMFLTLRKWLNERVAYMATLLTAMGWWTYANAFTIMTEPTFLLFMWGSLLALSCVYGARGGKRWFLVGLGAVLMMGAWENRVAAILLVPGAIAGLLLTCRRVASKGEMLGWLGIFVFVLGLCLFDYYRPVSTQASDLDGGGIGIKDVGDRDIAMHAESGYRWNVMVGVSHPIVQMPINAGRWVLESLAAGFVYPFNSTSKVMQVGGGLLALLVVVVMVVGVIRLIRSGYWWPVALATYFFPLWLLWGTRVKARYMVPIAPILFIILWAGGSVIVAGIIRRVRARRGSQIDAVNYRTGAKVAMATMLLASLILNGAAYGVEFYLRRLSPYDFYDQARQGSLAELVDICAYLRKNTPPDTDVWLNRGASRRIIGVLCDRDVHTARNEVALANPRDSKHFSRLKPLIKGPYLIALYDQNKWPQFHIPLVKPAPAGAPPRFWQLFEVDPVTKAMKPVAVPRDREMMQHLFLSPKR
jgi:hypothetical protein